MKEKELPACPFATSQRILQGKWAILILHNLSAQPLRFHELQSAIHISQGTLSNQLKYLEEGMINRKVYPEVPPRVEYSLTEIGHEFQPVLDAIEVWGNKYIEYLKKKSDDRQKIPSSSANEGRKA